MTTAVSASGGLFDTRLSAYKQLFTQISHEETTFFDECVRPLNIRSLTTASISGSIDTREIDPYTQGVELTSQRRYDAGVVKIWSGEPGHQLRKNRFGMDRNIVAGTTFADSDYFNPQTYLQLQVSRSPLWSSIITFPILVEDTDQSENDNFNGVIEPLSIRKVANFSSIDVPFEAHAVRGAYGNGNIDALGTTDQVVTIFEIREREREVGFLDLVDAMGNTPLNGYFDGTLVRMSPFVDQRLVRNTSASIYMSSDIVGYLSHMTGSTDNYIRPGYKSATCGRDYDNITDIGTDSLAFGGMTY